MNTEENQGTIAEEEFRLLTHPLLSFADDEFFSSIVERLTSPNYAQEFVEIMKGLVFNDHDVNELNQISFCDNTVCGKSINDNEIFFVCLDCDLGTHPNLYSLLCYGCFEKSNHKGHRLYITKEEQSSVNCDCGDAQLLKPEGFCSGHQFKPINIQELYGNFPQELREKYEGLIKKSIYGVVSLFELKQHALSNEVSELADDLMNAMLNLWIECYSQANRAFLPILWTTLRGQFDSPWDLVWHDCGDLRAENKGPQEPHKCNCSLLGNLFRISHVMNKENQEKLKKILMECVKDQDFLGYLAVEFTKYIHFFFTQNYQQEASEDNPTDHHSLVWRLYLHLYPNDKILEKVLDSGYFENFLSLISKVVNGCTRVSPVTSLIIYRMRRAFDYCLVPSFLSAQRFVKEDKFILQYLDIVMTYQMKFYYTEKLSLDLFDHQINYDSLNLTLRTERNLCRPFENLITLIEKLTQPEQKQRLARLLQKWYLNLQNSRAVLKGEDGEQLQSFNPCLERLFCCVLINEMKDQIETNNFEKFMKENFDCVHEVALNTIEGPLRALGMMRYLHLTFNYKSGNIFEIYYFIENAFFETDVVMTQMMMLMLKPEEGLFELLVDNFFSYSPEIRGFFKDPKEENYDKKRLTVIEDFLYFLVFLMTDEVCLLNVQSKYKKDNGDLIELNQQQKLVAKNLLVNILRGFYWTTGKEVTYIYHEFLIANQEIDQILLEVTIKDEKNQKIRIKDEYESNINPSIFYKLPSIRQSVVEAFTTKNSQKNNPIDLLSALLDKDAPQYLKDIQRNLYQSRLPEFLCRYLKAASLKTSATLIHLVLKLIFLNFQVAEENSPENDLLRQNIKNNYVTDDFCLILDNISTEDNFRDCRSCLENIKKLLQKFEGNKTMLVENSPRTQRKEENEKKKLTAQERMEQLKQSFAQKQAAFAQKNESMLQKSMSFEGTEESKRDEHFVCQHCMERLHVSGKEYGLLIYITFTNNFYDTTTTEGVFVEQDYKNLLKADWWPVISSCNHYYHRKCFEVIYKAPKNLEKKCLSNAYESFCPLCKGLCNNFLSLNGEEKESDEINQEASQEQLEMYPQIYQSFTKKIQKLLVDLKAKIQLSPAGHATALEEASFVSVETIFERAYQYFIESFHLLENSQNLKKNFELYLAFFKGFKSYFTNSKNKIPEDNLQVLAFFNVTNLFLSTQASYPANFLNYKTEVYLIELLAKNFQRILATSDISGQSELFALKDFILLKVIQTIAFHHNSDDPSNLKLEDCFQLYQSNQDLRTAILNELVFPIQKIILSYTLNITAASSSSPNLNLLELFDLLYSEQNNKEEYLTNLFNAVKVPYSFSDLILEIFQELSSRPQSEINFLSSLFDNKLFSREILKPQPVKFAPRMIQLPENYLEFNTQYFPKKCNLCKAFSSHLFTSICLICGEVMCTSYCNNDVNHAGNLNRHSKKYHMGMGVFLDLQDLHQNLINTPLNLSYKGKGLYLNMIGQDIVSFLDEKNPINIARLDFTEFQANPEYVREFIEIINKQALRKHIFTVGLRIAHKTNDGFL